MCVRDPVSLTYFVRLAPSPVSALLDCLGTRAVVIPTLVGLLVCEFQCLAGGRAQCVRLETIWLAVAAGALFRCRLSGRPRMFPRRAAAPGMSESVSVLSSVQQQLCVCVCECFCVCVCRGRMFYLPCARRRSRRAHVCAVWHDIAIARFLGEASLLAFTT